MQKLLKKGADTKIKTTIHSINPVHQVIVPLVQLAIYARNHRNFCQILALRSINAPTGDAQKPQTTSEV